jgi:hypothetical protein
VLFHIDVTTLLDNPVGPRYFQVMAEGVNSTTALTLVVIIDERNVPPFIEVEYDFYGNVSVPMTFDASRTWDREGDNTSFQWLMDSATIGTGPVLVHTFDEEGDYVIELVASDGVNERRETLEVSIQDAIPPTPELELLDWDKDAAWISWRGDDWTRFMSSWDSSRFFSEYRVYASENNTDPDLIMAEGNVVERITRSYETNRTVIMPFEYWYSEEVHLLVTVVNIYGLETRSNVITFEPEIRHGYREPPDLWYVQYPLLYGQWIGMYNVTKYSFEVEWREWLPIGEGGHYTFDVWVKRGAGDLLHKEMDRIDDLSDTGRKVVGLDPRHQVSVYLSYHSADGKRAWGVSRQFHMVENVPPEVQVAPRIDARAGKEFTFHITASDPDGELTYLTIDWGDGSGPQGKPGRNYSLDRTYEEAGNYTITVEVWDDDDVNVTMTTLVIVSAAEDRPGDSFWDPVIAIALIIFVALLGVIVGHLSGYYRIGREHEAKGEEAVPEVEPEVEVDEAPEPTAEEIISELEEELGEGEDGEYFDHEPTVSELEEMIPRDGK